VLRDAAWICTIKSVSQAWRIDRAEGGRLAAA
jgi:hypothetical protein